MIENLMRNKGFTFALNIAKLYQYLDDSKRK